MTAIWYVSLVRPAPSATDIKSTADGGKPVVNKMQGVKSGRQSASAFFYQLTSKAKGRVNIPKIGIHQNPEYSQPVRPAPQTMSPLPSGDKRGNEYVKNLNSAISSLSHSISQKFRNNLKSAAERIGSNLSKVNPEATSKTPARSSESSVVAVPFRGALLPKTMSYETILAQVVLRQSSPELQQKALYASAQVTTEELLALPLDPTNVDIDIALQLNAVKHEVKAHVEAQVRVGAGEVRSDLKKQPGRKKKLSHVLNRLKQRVIPIGIVAPTGTPAPIETVIVQPFSSPVEVHTNGSVHTDGVQGEKPQRTSYFEQFKDSLAPVEEVQTKEAKSPSEPVATAEEMEKKQAAEGFRQMREAGQRVAGFLKVIKTK